MATVIQFFVNFVILPAVYVVLMWFDFNLLKGARTSAHRIQMLMGVFTGILICIIVIILDQTTNLFSQLDNAPDPTKVLQVLPYLAVAFGLGVILMLTIHVVLRTRSAQSFIVLLITVTIGVSGYFLLTVSEFRSVFATSAIGFLVGMFLYLMLQPDLVPPLLGFSLKAPDAPRGAGWD